MSGNLYSIFFSGSNLALVLLLILLLSGPSDHLCPPQTRVGTTEVRVRVMVKRLRLRLRLRV